MKSVFKLGFGGILLLMMVAGDVQTARADRRAFTYTYEYVTQPQGNLELEFYNTQSRSKWGDGAISSWAQQIEVEYGITDYTDVSLYQVFEETEDEGVHYAETKLRMRHRFGERGLYPVDLLVYMELVKPFGRPAVEIEPKLVVSRDFGAVTAVVNLIPEVEVAREFEPSGDKELELEFEPGWAAGVTYEVVPQLKVGGETFGTIHEPFDDARFVQAWVGPAVSWAPSTRLYLTVTPAFGLTDESDKFLVRFLLGLGL